MFPQEAAPFHPLKSNICHLVSNEAASVFLCAFNKNFFVLLQIKYGMFKCTNSQSGDKICKYFSFLLISIQMNILFVCVSWGGGGGRTLAE